MSISAAEPALSAHDLHAGYGRLPVLHGVSLSVRAGEVLTVLGRNGAGKTTLMKVLAGQLPTRRGHAALSGLRISALEGHAIARAGLAYVPQGRGIFGRLTVEENLLLGTRALARPLKQVPEGIYATFPALAAARHKLGGALSGGQQQQLAIGRALAGSPKVLLLDEPAEGIQPNVVQEIGALLRRVAGEQHLAVLLVEQNLALGLPTADRCIVLEKGAVVHEAPPADFEDPELLRRYLAV